MNKIRIISLVLFLLFLFSSCEKNINAVSELQNHNLTGVRFTEKSENVTKAETVYINLDANGKLRKITVNNWIHTDKSGVYVDDISILDNITNIKGYEIPQINGENLRWHMEEKDLYYSGTTNKIPPVLFDVEYYLDGKIITPEDLAGKSGEITIRIIIRNNLYKEITVDGAKYTVTLPVAAVGGMILPDNIFSDVAVTNAQTFNDGSKQLIGFAAIPGLDESFGISNNRTEELTDYFAADEITVKAHAENFILENMYFAVVPLATLNFDMMMYESVGDVGTAVNMFKAFRDAIKQLDPDRIIYSLISDEAKLNSLLGAIRDASVLYEDNQNLIELAGKYSTTENINSIRRLLEILNTPEVKAMLEVISDPEVQSFITGLPVIMENFGDVEPLLNELQKDLSRPEIQNELSALPQTIKTLSDITTVLSENKNEIDAIFSALDGYGANSPESILGSINSDDIESLEDKYGDVIEDSDVLTVLFEEWLRFGREYGLFSGKAENMEYSLMFIYKTESIR